MRKHILGLAVAVAAATIVGGTTTVAAAPPADMHCDGHSSPDVTKVELDGNVTHLDLAEGTVICVKAGTENTGPVTVGEGGFTNTIVNRRGNIRGISYYVVYEQPPPCDPYDITSDCYEEPSGS